MSKIIINQNPNPTDLDLERSEKRAKRKKLILTILICFFLSIGLAAFALSWQQSYTMLAFCNAFYFSGFIFFFVGWIILMSNMNILSPVIYGLKSFFLMFAAKKPKTDYYAYTQEVKENPIPKFYVVTPFLAAIPNFIVAVILHILLV